MLYRFAQVSYAPRWYRILHNRRNMYLMATVSDIRRTNARALADKAGGLAAFARRIERSDPFVSQLLGRNPTREIGHGTARLIEQAFGLPLGWLDAAHDDSPKQPAVSPAALAFAQWLDEQPPEKQRQLREIARTITGSAVPDAAVEERMPVTKRPKVE
jgi:hypothetical protein